MPRYTLKWMEVCEEQYDSLPMAIRELVDRRIKELLEDPTGNPHAKYDEQFDQWSVPVGPGGFILYAVVREAAQVILLRLVSGLG